MAAGEQGDEHSLQHLLLADDDALHLEQRALELVSGALLTGDDERAIDLRHAISSFREWVQSRVKQPAVLSRVDGG
jgi:hypothetical protein